MCLHTEVPCYGTQAWQSQSEIPSHTLFLAEKWNCSQIVPERGLPDQSGKKADSFCFAKLSQSNSSSTRSWRFDASCWARR